MSAGVPNKGCGECRQGETFPLAFTMAFQPVIDSNTNCIYAHEALVRGPDGQSAKHILDQVTPNTRYAFDQLCRIKAIELARQLNIEARLNINFMPNAVYEPRACIQRTLEAAARVGLPLEQITFEIVEDERIIDHAHLLGIIDEYRRHGFRIALDDFGAGYSGLNVLIDIRPHLVKLDRAIIHGLDTDKVRRTVALGMIRVCADLGIDVVAEGVETKDEYAVLRDAGVRYYQGYLFAKPAFERLVTSSELLFGARNGE